MYETFRCTSILTIWGLNDDSKFQHFGFNNFCTLQCPHLGYTYSITIFPCLTKRKSGLKLGFFINSSIDLGSFEKLTCTQMPKNHYTLCYCFKVEDTINYQQTGNYTIKYIHPRIFCISSMLVSCAGSWSLLFLMVLSAPCSNRNLTAATWLRFAAQWRAVLKKKKKKSAVS